MKHTNDIIRMAQEAGCIPVRHPEYDNDVRVFATPDVLERFAAIVADRCAEIAHEAEPFHSADLIRKAFGVDK
jgi:hypothetical protein